MSPTMEQISTVSVLHDVGRYSDELSYVVLLC